jgi:hypothetical protein
MIILHLKPEDNPKRYDLSMQYECTLWKCGKFSRQNTSFLSTENPDFSRSLERYSTKWTGSCCLLHDRAIGSFFFHETRVKWKIYLYMLKYYAVPQLLQAQEECGFVITLQKDLRHRNGQIGASAASIIQYNGSERLCRRRTEMTLQSIHKPSFPRVGSW